jgi:hypothetical protein
MSVICDDAGGFFELLILVQFDLRLLGRRALA